MRGPQRPSFRPEDLEFFTRLGTFIGVELRLAERRSRAETHHDLLIREEISRELQAGTVGSIMSALRALESVADRARPPVVHERIVTCITELEAALVTARQSVLTGLSPL